MRKNFVIVGIWIYLLLFPLSFLNLNYLSYRHCLRACGLFTALLSSIIHVNRIQLCFSISDWSSLLGLNLYLGSARFCSLIPNVKIGFQYETFYNALSFHHIKPQWLLHTPFSSQKILDVDYDSVLHYDSVDSVVVAYFWNLCSLVLYNFSVFKTREILLRFWFSVEFVMSDACMQGISRIFVYHCFNSNTSIEETKHFLFYCHSPTQPQDELELDLIMGRNPPHPPPHRNF